MHIVLKVIIFLFYVMTLMSDSLPKNVLEAIYECSADIIYPSILLVPTLLHSN